MRQTTTTEGRVAPEFRGGGEEARRRLAAELLGLRFPPSSARAIRPLALFFQEEPPRIVISVAGRESRADIVIEPRDDDKPAFARSERLNLSYVASGTVSYATKLAKRLADRVNGVGFEELVRLVEGLPGVDCRASTRSDLDEDPVTAPAGNRVDRASHQRWCESEDQRRFVATAGDWARAQHTLFQPRFPWARVLHGDLECVYVGSGDFLSYPWLSPWAKSRRDKSCSPLNLTTDLREKDVIGGTKERLVPVLDLLAERSEERMTMLNSTCVPSLMGEDAAGVLRDRLKDSEHFVYFLDPVRGGDVEACLEAVEALGIERHEGGAEPRTVNLIGFHDCQGTDELRVWLEDEGVRVGAALFPSISPDTLASYGRAAVQVVRGSRDWIPLIERATNGLNMRTEVLHAPYGLEPSFDWLASVCAFVGVEAVVQDGVAELRERWEELRKQASSHTLGFIGTAAELERLRSPRHLFGVPVIPMAEEMGFQVFALDPDTPLRDIGASAVYSDFTCDSRLVEAGHTPFSSQLFEMGPQGALRSLERLLDCCRLPFHRRFSSGRRGEK